MTAHLLDVNKNVLNQNFGSFNRNRLGHFLVGLFRDVDLVVLQVHFA